MKQTGRIADIQRSSFHDGPGIRTTVFFKGCPLQCKWCHNPECISKEIQELFYAKNCIGCQKCEEGCFSNARVICGKDYTPDALLEEILQDKLFYRDGGVTFSGGEPMLQKEFLLEILSLCREHKIHCAVETSLIYFHEDVLKMLDLVIADLKIWDDEMHQYYTGVSNKQIKNNFIKLNDLNVPVIARTPVIPEISQGIPEISQFLYKLNNVKQYELLPYHPLGKEKEKALGITQCEFSVPDNKLMEELNRYAFIR